MKVALILFQRASPAVPMPNEALMEDWEIKLMCLILPLIGIMEEALTERYVEQPAAKIQMTLQDGHLYIFLIFNTLQTCCDCTKFDVLYVRY